MAVKLIDLIPKAGKITDDISSALKSYRSKGRIKKYFQPHEVTINGQKYVIRADDFRASQAEQLEQGFKDLNKWKKDPTVRNWNNIFRTPSGTNTAFSKNIRSYITGKKATGGLPLTSNAKKLFDKLKVKDLIGPETKIIKDYTSDYFKKLRPLVATEVSAEKALKASAAEVKQLAPLFKTKTKRSLEEITKKINPNYVKANEVDKADMLQQTSNKVAKYLQFLKGERKAGKLQQPKKTEEIIDWIESESSDFRFQEGIIRDMKFTARDKELGLKAGTTRNQRAKVSRFADPGFAVDEAVGLSATYRSAPGYTEATQILSQDINSLKGVQIDKTFGKVLNEVIEGNTKNVESYNKKARQFMKDNPNVDVPIIKTGKNLDPKKFVSYFNEYSPQAQSSILNQAKTQNFVIQTKSKPVARLIKDLQQQGKSYEEALAMVATLGTGTVGGMAVTSSDALSDTVSDDDATYMQVGYNLGGDTDFGDPDTWDMSVGKFMTAGGLAPLATKKGRSLYGTAAKTIAKLPLKAITSPILGNPLAVGAMTYGLRPEEGYDFSDPLTRVGFESLGAFSKPIVDAATQTAQKIPASMPFARKATEFAARGFLPARLAFGLARIATPLGVASLGVEGGMALAKLAKERQAEIDAMSSEERENFFAEQEGLALAGEAAEFAMGGRVGFKTGGKGDKRGIKGLESKLPIDPNMPQDPDRRNFLQKMGIGSLGIGALMTGAVKFGPKAVTTAEKVASKFTSTNVPAIVEELYSTIRMFGRQTEYPKPGSGNVKYEFGNYKMEEGPGGYSITKTNEGEYSYSEEYFGVYKDAETGAIEYEELTVRPDMDGKLKDVDYGVDVEAYREIGEDLSKTTGEDIYKGIAEDDIKTILDDGGYVIDQGVLIKGK